MNETLASATEAAGHIDLALAAFYFGGLFLVGMLCGMGVRK
jgi:hypothetical protein